MLDAGKSGRAERAEALQRDGYPAYSTTPGWLGYSDDRLAALCAQAVDDGFTQVKLKVGARLADDKRRFALARATVGEKVGIAIDANQVWDVPTAISWVRELAELRPGLGRGADQPVGCPRHRRDQEGRAPGPGGDRRAHR